MFLKDEAIIAELQLFISIWLDKSNPTLFELGNYKRYIGFKGMRKILLNCPKTNRMDFTFEKKSKDNIWTNVVWDSEDIVKQYNFQWKTWLPLKHAWNLADPSH